MDADGFRKVLPEEFYRKFLEHGLRPDGRDTKQCRGTYVSRGSINTAAGSAMVKIGNTTMVAGVKPVVETPDDATPGNGRVCKCFLLAGLKVCVACVFSRWRTRREWA